MILQCSSSCLWNSKAPGPVCECVCVCVRGLHDNDWITEGIWSHCCGCRCCRRINLPETLSKLPTSKTSSQQMQSSTDLQIRHLETSLALDSQRLYWPPKLTWLLLAEVGALTVTALHSAIMNPHYISPHPYNCLNFTLPHLPQPTMIWATIK